MSNNNVIMGGGTTNLLLRRRMLMARKSTIVVPSNQIWYDANEKVTLHTETDVVSHEFSNGRGVVTFSGDITSVSTWFRATTITEVFLPQSITIIGEAAFFDCVQLHNIYLHEGITLIRQNSMRNCDSIERVTLPSTISSIGNYAFLGCDILSIVKILTTTPPPQPTSAVPNKTIIQVPSSSLEAYKDAWPQYASRIQAIPEGL